MNPAALHLLTVAAILLQAPIVGAKEPIPSPTQPSPSTASPVTDDEARLVKALLDQLPPSQTTLWRHIAQVKGTGPQVTEDQLKFANANLEKVREIIPQLRKSLKVGASIFSYPGLLAHGDITYQIIKGGGRDAFAEPAAPVEYGYRFYIGIPKSEFSHIYDFELLFDSQGIIRTINSVDWKN
ncbi:hypothetical protein [Verrucomicrobium sp. BvORR106]|uniref:hypothetical protein n=1 Tax=Verrucomicrobium sp. BvORR106 TaxID=1403819 RepID=UPI000571B1C9|nr:hypothetical protein [Verrucomicrobium sp. BvORR106]